MFIHISIQSAVNTQIKSKLGLIWKFLLGSSVSAASRRSNGQHVFLFQAFKYCILMFISAWFINILHGSHCYLILALDRYPVCQKGSRNVKKRYGNYETFFAVVIFFPPNLIFAADLALCEVLLMTPNIVFSLLLIVIAVFQEH